MSEENVSLPVAQALASALEKIEAYVPTEYVDNSEPDIDAEHLNHAEQGIMRVTNLLNAAVDVIQGQESRLADAETKIGTAALTGGMTDLSSGLNTLNSNFYMIDDATEHIESVYSLFRNNISVWGAFKNLTYHFRIGGNADSTFGNGHFSAYIMRDAAGAVYTAIIISKWLGDVWSMIFTTYDDVKIIKKLS